MNDYSFINYIKLFPEYRQVQLKFFCVIKDIYGYSLRITIFFFSMCNCIINLEWRTNFIKNYILLHYTTARRTIWY